ncbi:PorV/PorQ family protein [candidate division KSB1 bacterium]|nr:PorV/PorQ family protein [candidate division KSB1 bacterium]
MKVKNKIILVFIISIISVTISFSQTGIQKVGTTSFQFLKIKADARATAMGEAVTSVVNTSEAIFWNPANLSDVSDVDVSISYLDWLFDISHTAFSVAKSISGYGTVGIHAMITDVGSVEETRVDQLFRDETTGLYNPGLTGKTVSPGSQVFGLSFSRYVTDKFSFGVTVKYAREDLVKHTASSIIFDGGITYRTGFRSLILAAAIKEFGPDVTFVNKSYPLPQTLTIGFSAELLAPESALFMQSDIGRLLVAFDMVEARDAAQQYHTGMEFSMNDFFFLRGGYKINYYEQGLTLGFGLEIFKTRIDYSFNDFGDYIEPIHRITFGWAK